jgi:acetate---CoA ligase (ADP-forming)
VSPRLSRLLNPTSVAVVGASERRGMSNVALSHLLDAPVELHLVNPNATEAYGRPTVASLTAIGRPVDAVLALVGAERTIELVAEAASLGCGGVVAIAAGFGEAGADGVNLEERLRAAVGAADMPVVGPNCTGFANIAAGVSLFTGTPTGVRAGNVSLVSSSGYLMRAAMVAARERNLGIRLAVSSGNETVTTFVDYVSRLIDDPQTDVICAVIEKIRDVDGFFEITARARAAGKPIVILKVGRSDRARDIVHSHTGALTSEGWLYDIAMRDAGVIAAVDIDDLMDRTAVLAQLPRSRWTSARRVAVVTSSGGVAAMVSDMLSDVVSDVVDGGDVEFPSLDSLRSTIEQFVPGARVVNPLDLTGMAMSDPNNIVGVLDTLMACDEVDAVMVCWWVGADDEQRAEMLLEPVRRCARGKPVVLASIESSAVGSWSTARDDAVFCRGVRSAIRGLAAMTEHVKPDVPRAPAVLVDPLPRPTAVVDSEIGTILAFDAAMQLLTDAGITVARWRIVDAGGAWDRAALGADVDRVVVKLADVAHRTELGGVRIGVAVDDVAGVAAELAAIANDHGLSERVVVQAMVAGDAEAFIGGRGATELGGFVVVGLGGVLVELTRQVVGGLVPTGDAVIETMLDELAETGVFGGLRGSSAWDREALGRALQSVALLIERCSGWLDSIDINPLIRTPNGFVAVDVLISIVAND